ncbi:hypothetical protein MLP_46190 [Microlunatus phosphovorus NM-1]|uniref:DUF541 domain-containing protein n=1 Tax=Microlunatus phosphovorus (strain ATCC 700054 / DSM 10555 / JCM 9379 / NBRC 101784 / NCIMB 13414 / VKM Ac-1990 / NM-1) TaxID=1032480 RepID=F5XE85_MICPN|nr:hypothetical protein MLP_46190 [Microlunatus phosphovorus NM-1]
MVTVRGEAELVSAPDLATISATVHRTGPDADRVRRELAEASALIRAIVAERRSSLERHSTSGLHVGPVFSGRGGQRISGYRGRLSTELVVADFAALADLIAAVSALDGAQVDGPWWSLRPANAIYRQVRIAAIEEAKRRAADYAAAFDATLGELVEVSDLDGSIGAPRMMKAFAMDSARGGGEPELDLEPAEQRVGAQVTVRFQLADD